VVRVKFLSVKVDLAEKTPKIEKQGEIIKLLFGVFSRKKDSLQAAATLRGS
jgi:hypothetical protein